MAHQMHDTEARWFAVKTRSKSEKSVQKRLEKKGIPCYLPLQHLMRQYGRVKRTVSLPLINCYVFVHITREMYVPVLETEHVTGFVQFDRRIQAIPEHEIEIIRRITLEKGLDLSVQTGAIASGDVVEISAGNLMGLKGRVIRRESKKSFQVELLTLQMNLLISIDAAFLEKLPPNLAAKFE